MDSRQEKVVNSYFIELCLKAENLISWNIYVIKVPFILYLIYTNQA